MGTKIIDIIEPAVFTKYSIQRTMEKSTLLQAGIAENNALFNELATGPNTLIDMPYWEDLTGDAEVVADTGQTTPDKITAQRDKAKKMGFVKSWGVNALAAHLSGDDPLGTIVELVAEYWNRQMQEVLLSTLDGVFGATSMATKIHDITGETGNDALINAYSFLDAAQLMGDSKELLTGVMMHSAIETHLLKNELLEVIRDSEGKPVMKTFLGKQVTVNDNMAFDTVTKGGDMYLFGAGALAWGNGSDPQIMATEMVRDGLSKAGEDVLVTRRINMLHPRGVKWLEASIAGTFPTLDELAMGANWERVYEPKAVRIVKFRGLIA